MDTHLDDDELDEQHINPPRKNIPATFMFDDAFSDNEDVDVPEFSPSAIRKDLAKHMRIEDAYEHTTESVDINLDDIVTKIEYSVEPDASVSTIDINGGHDSSPSSPHTPPLSRMQSSSSCQDSLHEVPLSSEFSQVSLSDKSPPAFHHDEAEPASPIDSGHPPATDLSLSVGTASEEDHVELPTSIRPITYSSFHRNPQHSASHTEFRDTSHPPSSHEHKPPATASASTSSLPISTSLPTPTTVRSSAAEPPTPTTVARHRPSKSSGPSMLDKVISKTRPPHLPPKPKTEDKKHMHDWEEMMKLSRAAEDKRRKALQERRLAREQRIEDSIHIWEREIVPDWTVVHRNQQLRRLWWQGVPTKLRALMWQSAIGNALALSKDSYKTCLSRAKRALASGTFPTTVLRLLEADIATTLPSTHLFIPDKGPLYQDLKDMLCAWVVARSDEGHGYVAGVAKITAMILINMSPTQGFIVLRNLLERHCLRSFYGGMGSKDDVDAYYRIFDTLLADGMPKIYFNFKQHQVSPAAYLPDWLVPLFLDHLPFEACARVWDVIFLEGDAFLYRAALAVLGVLEPRLFFPDKKELLELLRGENKAALEIAQREHRISHNGKYEIYSVDEENVWERIESMDEWWRESTWKRLIERELPDL